jgi:hypothetical protein
MEGVDDVLMVDGRTCYSCHEFTSSPNSELGMLENQADITTAG